LVDDMDEDDADARVGGEDDEDAPGRFVILVIFIIPFVPIGME
jgi:hypothetical protein